MASQASPEETAAALTWPQRRDLGAFVILTAEHPTWTLPRMRTSTPLVVAGCLEFTDGLYLVTPHGRAVVAVDPRP